MAHNFEFIAILNKNVDEGVIIMLYFFLCSPQYLCLNDPKIMKVSINYRV